MADIEQNRIHLHSSHNWEISGKKSLSQWLWVNSWRHIAANFQSCDSALILQYVVIACRWAAFISLVCTATRLLCKYHLPLSVCISPAQFGQMCWISVKISSCSLVSMTYCGPMGVSLKWAHFADSIEKKQEKKNLSIQFWWGGSSTWKLTPSD